MRTASTVANSELHGGSGVGTCVEWVLVTSGDVCGVGTCVELGFV